MAAPSAPSISAVMPLSAEPSNAKTTQVRELTRMAIAKTTSVQRPSWRNTSAIPRNKALARSAAVNTTVPAAGRRLQAGLDRGARVHKHRVDGLRRTQLPELVEGEQQQPGRPDERGGGQRCHVSPMSSLASPITTIVEAIAPSTM